VPPAIIKVYLFRISMDLKTAEKQFYTQLKAEGIQPFAPPAPVQGILRVCAWCGIQHDVSVGFVMHCCHCALKVDKVDGAGDLGFDNMINRSGIAEAQRLGCHGKAWFWQRTL
jgi:hypothetical protein